MGNDVVQLAGDASTFVADRLSGKQIPFLF